MNVLWDMVVSNAVAATLLAVGVAALGRLWKHPAVLHCLWLTVLLRLFTPPLLLISPPALFVRQVAVEDPIDLPTVSVSPSVRQTNEPDTAVIGPRQPQAVNPVADVPREAQLPFGQVWSVRSVLLTIWLIGSAGMGLLAIRRIRAIRKLVQQTSNPTADLLEKVSLLAERIGLRAAPRVRMSTATIPPLVWCVSLRPIVVLPTGLFDRLDDDARESVVAHELAHIRRGDHLVRMLELAATTLFWWHPVAWWASSRMRDLEEECCDGRVRELQPDKMSKYASALVDTLDFLAERRTLAFPLSTAVSSTGSIERRIRVLAEHRPCRLNVTAYVFVGFLMMTTLVTGLSLRPAVAQQAADKAACTAVIRGQVTNDANEPLSRVRVRVAIPGIDMRFVDFEENLRVVETTTDAEGRYQLEIPELGGETTASLDASKPGYQRLVGTLQRGGDVREMKIAPGSIVEQSFTLTPALYFKGKVLDEQGRPIEGVKVSANMVGTWSGGIELTVTGPDGIFELHNYPTENKKIDGEVGPVLFFHPNYVGESIQDVYTVDPEQRDSLQLTLGSGRRISGKVIDADGQPLPNVMVKVINEKVKLTGVIIEQNRKAVLTDAAGQFSLSGLTRGAKALSVHAFDIDQKRTLPLILNGDETNVEVRLEKIAVPSNLKTYQVLGMTLADVTPEVQAAYDLPLDSGALIVDPGTLSDRLGIGNLSKGFLFWMVGDTRIHSVQEFVTQMAKESESGGSEAVLKDVNKEREGQPPFAAAVRVVFTCSTLESDANNTQYANLTREEVDLLKKQAEEGVK